MLGDGALLIVRPSKWSQCDSMRPVLASHLPGETHAPVEMSVDEFIRWMLPAKKSATQYFLHLADFHNFGVYPSTGACPLNLSPFHLGEVAAIR